MGRPPSESGGKIAADGFYCNQRLKVAEQDGARLPDTSSKWARQAL